VQIMDVKVVLVVDPPIILQTPAHAHIQIYKHNEPLKKSTCVPNSIPN
jgi:hypothetical protein